MVDLPKDYMTDEPPLSRPFQGELNMTLPNGLLNVTACKFNSPAYVSLPHFYLADPALLDQFHPDSDLHPNPTDHSAHLTLMPKQGIPLDVAIRMQINILYRPMAGFPIDMFANVKPTFFPAVWFETTTVLPYSLATQMQMLQMIPYLGTYLGAFFLTLGLLIVITDMLVFGTILVLLRNRPRPKMYAAGVRPVYQDLGATKEGRASSTDSGRDSATDVSIEYK